VFDVYQMFDVLHQLKINLRSEVLIEWSICSWCNLILHFFYQIDDYCILSQIVKSNQHVRLLIVDSISSLITPILGGSGPQGIVHLCTQNSLLMFTLKDDPTYHINLLSCAVVVYFHSFGASHSNSVPFIKFTCFY